MSYTIRWTTQALNTFNENLDYLAEEWDHQVINHFLDRVDEVIEQISKNPELYPLHKRKGSCV